MGECMWTDLHVPEEITKALLDADSVSPVKDHASSEIDVDITNVDATYQRKKSKRNNLKETPPLALDDFGSLALIEELDAHSGEVQAVYDLAAHRAAVSIPCDTAGGRVHGVVLVPTRELALQVCQHLRMLTKFMSPTIRIQPIVGGMSVEKQRRLLNSRPDILVATPGRLLYFLAQEDSHVSTLLKADVFVVDEADRFVEAKHLDQLEQIFHGLPSQSNESGKPRISRQIMVFSATLTFVHRGALDMGMGSRKRKIKLDRSSMTVDSKLGIFRSLLGMSKRSKIFDLSNPNPDSIAASTGTEPQCSRTLPPTGLIETKMTCLSQSDKDFNLFWFLALGRFLSPQSSTRRCLIFLNSKAGVRRLAGVMRQLVDTNAFSAFNKARPSFVNVLHADMIQRQRLRALERFQADPNGILLASDVASRGLDFAYPSQDAKSTTGAAPTDTVCEVNFVVHFEVPHTAELYIHRRGRTARANRSGTSVLFVCPDELVRWRRLASSLQRQDSDLRDFQPEPTDWQLSACREIVDRARQLDLMQHTSSRKRATESWFQRAAREADICPESEASDDNDDLPISKKKAKGSGKSTDPVTQRRELLQIIGICQKQAPRQKSTNSNPGTTFLGQVASTRV